jgi:dinuclear metal center YbgI/SA1388 family protein
MKLNDIISYLEALAPPALQESYDNSGLICGSRSMQISKAIICLDAIEDVLDEAIEKGANLVIAHHPIVFSGLKTFTGKNYVERIIIKAIKNDIAIYAIHTNLDNVMQGVNAKIAEMLEIEQPKILTPKRNTLSKLVYFTPEKDAENIKKVLFEAGAGNIGNYAEASFETTGKGTFKGNENATPVVGQKLQRETVTEIRTELLIPRHLEGKIVHKLKQVHPYEEVAYDVYALENKNQTIGAGMIGHLKEEMEPLDFLNKLKKTFKCGCIKHTNLGNKKIKKVAWCGGSGSFLLKNAMQQKADIYITGDFKYHEFFDAENKIIIADIGHFESEQYTNELLFAKLTNKFPTFAFLLTEINTNPVKYYT